MSQPDILAQYGSHPFDTDEEYQQGLSAILSSGALDHLSEEERSTALRRTRVFYFNKTTGSNLSEEDAQRAELERTEFASGPPAEETHTLSFAELQELITQGKTDQIPNNKQIPDALSDATPSESVEQPRKKPWEK